MELYPIDSQHFIDEDNVRSAMCITEQAFELSKDRFEYECKSLGIVQHRDVCVMPCKIAVQFVNWYMDSTYQRSNSLMHFCRDLKPYTKKIPKRVLSRSLRIEIAYRQRYQCNKCGLFPIPPNFEVDHIIELQDGGQDVASNLQALCPGCHAEKTRLNRLRKNRVFQQETQAQYETFVKPSQGGQVFSKYFSENAL